jgi:hypothetical protein
VDVSPHDLQVLKNRLCCLQSEVKQLEIIIKRCCEHPATSNLDGVVALAGDGLPTPALLTALVPGDYVLRVEVTIVVAFVGGAPEILVGTTANPSLIVGPGQVDLRQQDAQFEFGGSVPIFAADSLIVTYQANGATAGSVRVLAVVQR